MKNFTRYDAHTEPCGIVDSYMVASKLWSLTQDPQYLPELDLIYYNALAHGQRENGGFGCDIHPRVSINNIAIHVPEAHWCCTMRGAEGLSSVAESGYFTQKDTAYLVHYINSKATLHFKKKSFITFRQTTDYPFSGGVKLVLTEVHPGDIAFVPFNTPHTTEASDVALTYLCMNSIVGGKKYTTFDEMYNKVAADRIKRWKAKDDTVGL